jgi:hypothetical protein
MRRILSLLVLAAVCLFAVAGCSNEDPKEKAKKEPPKNRLKKP